MMIRIEAVSPKEPRNGNWDGWIPTWDAAIAEARSKVVDGELYLLSRHGGYFRPHARGYTGSMATAGLFSAAVARRYLDVEGLSVIPLSSVVDRMREELEKLEKEVAALRIKIREPALAVADPA
jgi:hypothetical protein